MLLRAECEGPTLQGELVALIQAGDVDGLKANAWKPYDSRMVALVRYRDMAIVAFEARRGARYALAS